ncbi:MAG: bifunctional phosphopantothenoylcysteine decarboxylase/phosphopantothenate--cysteine ligase CoaBC, partial [Clostridiaceae bacterium]
HISLAKKADYVCIIPATANIIGKIAHGIADDLLSTTIMATNAPVCFAPAMNTNMLNNKIVQENIAKLLSLGYNFISPKEGKLACGDIGNGKLEDTEIICEKINSFINYKKDLKGKKVLITAGPTISPIDPVRYITNHSSGKMGYKIAEAARDRGADTYLVSGPTNLKKPNDLNFYNAYTNHDMKDIVDNLYDEMDIVISAAAVSDFKIDKYSDMKIKKKDNLVLNLEKDKDILKSLGKKKKNQILVGFAAESNEIFKNAKIKLEAKNLDFIVANDITLENSGFKSDLNKVSIISKDKKILELPLMEKSQIAHRLFDEIIK